MVSSEKLLDDVLQSLAMGLLIRNVAMDLEAALKKSGWWSRPHLPTMSLVWTLKMQHSGKTPIKL